MRTLVRKYHRSNPSKVRRKADFKSPDIPSAERDEIRSWIIAHLAAKGIRLEKFNAELAALALSGSQIKSSEAWGYLRRFKNKHQQG